MLFRSHYGANDDYAFQTIQKQQMHQVSDYRHELNENGVSFKAWQNPKGEIFFIYNDNPKNEPNEFVERMSTLLLKSNYGRVTLVTIDEDNQITGNSLMPNDFLFIKHAMDINHGNLYCAINFGKANLCKITLPEQGEYGTLSMNQSEETENIEDDIEDDDEEDDED